MEIGDCDQSKILIIKQVSWLMKLYPVSFSYYRFVRVMQARDILYGDRRRWSFESFQVGLETIERFTSDARIARADEQSARVLSGDEKGPLNQLPLTTLKVPAKREIALNCVSPSPFERAPGYTRR